MTKKIFTLGEGISRIQEEMDTQGELNVDQTEYVIYFNDGIEAFVRQYLIKEE